MNKYKSMDDPLNKSLYSFISCLTLPIEYNILSKISILIPSRIFIIRNQIKSAIRDINETT